MFGLPCIYAIWFLRRPRLCIDVHGLPTYGSGPFTDIGIMTTVPLLVAFLLLCVAEVVAGWLLWTRRRAGVVLALVLLPFEFAFWLGFALPLVPPFGVARTALVLLDWFNPGTQRGSTASRAAARP